LWDWIVKLVSASFVVGAVAALNRLRITRDLNRFHEDGNRLLARLRTRPLPMNLHRAQRLVAKWIENVHRYLTRPWNVPSRAATFLGDFETTRQIWEPRWRDPMMREIDDDIAQAEGLPDTARVYQQQVVDEVVRALGDRLQRLREIMGAMSPRS